MHEIRNHLAVAIANLEAFHDGVIEPSPARLRAVLQALGEVEVLLREVETPGDRAGTVRAGLPEVIDVCDVITNEVLGLEASAQEHGLHFSIRRCEHKAANCARFAGDPLRIAEIVNNVVTNAIRYTPAGGSIDVDCRRADGVLALAVSDSGPGVSQRDVGHIFERGFRGTAAAGKPGTGVGLALTKQFVEENGGSIVLEPSDRGARFVIRLPGTPLPTPTSDGRTISLL